MRNEKWIKSRQDELAVANGCYYDERAADRVIDFFCKCLRHTKGPHAGKPFEPLPWESDDLLRPLYGWKRADGTRRFRQVYVEIPKKNGKSTICSGISLYSLVADGEAGAEVYAAAHDRDQAKIVFNEAEAMVKSGPLADYLHCKPSRSRIEFPAKNGVFRALAADKDTSQGLNIHALIFDELHTQKTRAFWDSLIFGGAARSQPIIMAITTAGVDRSSVCYEQHTYAKNVLSGAVEDPYYLAIIYAADDADDWTSEEVWRKANPSLGVTIKIDNLRDACEQAKNSPALESAFRRYRLNQWTNAIESWLPSIAWAKCGQDYILEDLHGQQCYVGIDLASVTDTTAMVAYFPELKRLWMWCYIPEEMQGRREATTRARLLQWGKMGWITITEGNATDFGKVRADLNELAEVCDVLSVGVDQFNSTHLNTLLQEDGHQVLRYNSSYGVMSAPTKELARMVVEGELQHPRNPVLDWMVANAVQETDNYEHVRLSKKRSGDKIDGVIAAVIALGQHLAHSSVDYSQLKSVG